MGTYTNLTVADLYAGDVIKNTDKPLECAYYWIEAENMWMVRVIISKWFRWLNEGVANNHYPDLRQKVFSRERADAFIEALEDDMMIEEPRFSHLNRDAGPGFDRLVPHARQAFIQDVWSVLKTRAELWAEAEQRLKAGIRTPPKNWYLKRNQEPPLWWLEPNYKEDPNEPDQDAPVKANWVDF